MIPTGKGATEPADSPIAHAANLVTMDAVIRWAVGTLLVMAIGYRVFLLVWRPSTSPRRPGQAVGATIIFAGAIGALGADLYASNRDAFDVFVAAGLAAFAVTWLVEALLSPHHTPPTGPAL